MSDFSKEEIALTREQKAALFLEAQLLLALCQELLLEARAHHEEDERKELCYPIPVYPAGKAPC